ncbi:MAG TPA: nucleotide exchange factor GrpE [Candidatus Limnocylindrales bacterium]|nr:nucleotide exchange factor GrpE [Candidatus Limnocylindrales bacterium]
MDRPRRQPPQPHGQTQAPHRVTPVDVSPKKLLAEIQRLLAERDQARQDLEEAQKANAASAEERDDLQRERDEYLGALQRERAEFQNFRRRTSEERDAMLGLAAEDLIRKVLALADDFDRAVETRPAALDGDPWVEGIAAIDRKLRLLLESEGVSEIEGGPGESFDPRLHEAVANVPGTGRPDGEIVEELRRGYRLRDRVIRPALVAVAAHQSEPDTERVH